VKEVRFVGLVGGCFLIEKVESSTGADVEDTPDELVFKSTEILELDLQISDDLSRTSHRGASIAGFS
jgi:hypothetical protein